MSHPLRTLETVKILHTSDWHLGRSFHGASLLDEQAEALDRIARIVEEDEVELVIVAGDLYDRAVPPAPAVELLGDTLARLHSAGAAVAAISGNHDSAVRVGGHDLLLNRLGVALRGDHRRVDEPLLIDPPRDGGPPVAVYLIPYLEPVAVAPDLLDTESVEDIHETTISESRDSEAPPSLFDLLAPGPEERPVTSRGPRRPTQDRVTRAAVARIREDLDRRGDVRSVVVAHTFVAGGEVSESERDLSVGNVERVSLSTFDGLDLVALGHLHSPQRLDGDRVAYAGSPLPYSFSEEGQVKSVRMVDLAPNGSVTATTVSLGVGRPVRTIVGELADLLVDPDLECAESARVRVRLTDADLPHGAMSKLRARFPYAAELRHEPGGRLAVAGDDFVDAVHLRRLDPFDLVLRFWQEQEGVSATPSERELLGRALQRASQEVTS